MKYDLEEIVIEAVNEMVSDVDTKKKQTELKKKHLDKVHYVPIEYRVFGGQLQSLNIKFGNFLENFISKIISQEVDLEINEEFSGKRSNGFKISVENDKLIDEYITRCKEDKNLSKDVILTREFDILLQQVVLNNKRNYELKNFKNDIDILFKDKGTGINYYVEVKYQDDHDTGKFEDINRKFIKTYAYLSHSLNIDNSDDLVPILFYFNPAKQFGNIYLPEDYNIMRGSEFFDKFIKQTNYNEVKKIFSDTSKLKGTQDLFHLMYKNTMNLNK